MRKIIPIILIALALGGCTTITPPVEDGVDPLLVTATATVNGRTVTVRGCITGGVAPYWVLHFCNGDVICGEPPQAPCPVCPATVQTPCPPTEVECCYEFICEYEDVGTYDVVIMVSDSDGNQVWTSVRVNIVTPPVTVFTIVSTFGTGGSISPAGTVSVNEGDNATFTITAFPGYVIGDILVDGVSIPLTPTAVNGDSVYVYTFENVSQNHTIWAGFGLDTPPEPPK